MLFNYGPTGQLIQDRAKVPHSNQGRSILYNEAKDMNIEGRSKMSKAQLERAVDRRK